MLLPNNQPIEKQVRDTTKSLEVHSIFYTLQGEGPFAGTPAVFIRLAGCNLQCPLCDTDYTSNRTVMSTGEILEAVAGAKGTQRGGLAVITGGEPFRQYLAPLARRLLMAGHYVQIETNGTLDPTLELGSINVAAEDREGVYIVCSPKAGKVKRSIESLSCCYKYVLHADSVGDDGLPLTALNHKAHPILARPPVGWTRPIYLQPVDEQDAAENQRHQKAALDSAMAGDYIFQLQIHKLLGLE